MAYAFIRVHNGIVFDDGRHTHRPASITTVRVAVTCTELWRPHLYIQAEAVTSDQRNRNDDSSDDDSFDDDDNYAYENDDVSDELDGSHLVVVELVVVHDGRADLPSAANYMRQRMHQGFCEIPFDKGSLMPNPYSLKTEHKFSQQMYEPAEVIYESGTYRCEADCHALYIYIFSFLHYFCHLVLHQRADICVVT